MPFRLVKLSQTSYALWWIALLLVHAVAATFFGFFAYFYRYILGKKYNYLATTLAESDIGMMAETFPAIALFHALVALPHGIVIATSTDLTVKALPSNQTRYPAAILRRVAWVKSLFERTGLFGVDGKYFYFILICREFFETSIQTSQAYRMSFYLPHIALNRFYVSLIVLSCWSTPLIVHLYKRDEAKKRLICLICDCALDLVAAVVIPCVIIATYVKDFDMELQGFPMEFWYDDIWNMHAIHEFQILFVASWNDLATRMVFSVGMLIVMSDIKDLLGARYSYRARGNQVAGINLINLEAKVPAQQQKSAKVSPVTVNDIPSATSPRFASSRTTSMRLESIRNRLRTASLALKNPTYQHRFTHFVHTFVILWGAVVLGFHLHAASVPMLSQCLLQVRPWGESQPVCALVPINCYEFAINGAKEDIDAQWSRLNPEMVVEAVIRHCPALEMPSIIQQFSHMSILKVYNTSITEWSADSALTGTYHPNLASLYFIRVNMTDGVLPPGLLSPEFPSTLADIEMSTTNLRMLPDDLDTKWPTDGALMFEYSEFTSIPAVVTRLRPFLLSFCGNPIEEIPAELFAIESMYYLHIGDNQNLKALPANATLSGALGQFYLERTQIAFFSSWLDPLVDFAVAEGFQTFRAVGTPYCEYATPVFNDSLSNTDAMAAVRAKTKTPAMLGPGKPSILMDTSESTRPIIYRAVVCGAGTERTFFPLSTEDRQSALR